MSLSSAFKIISIEFLFCGHDVLMASQSALCLSLCTITVANVLYSLGKLFTTHFIAMCTPYLFNGVRRSTFDVRRRTGYTIWPFSVQYLFNMITYPPAKIIIKYFHLS